ncbi:MAG: hypothetical protein DWQ05_11700 [Calditrichaeota bacterium]|nr:MAG: hypothetical protein DWQ05_11700 [Calditrichota bacterium]
MSKKVLSSSLVILLLASAGTVLGQSLKGSNGIGLNIGANQQYSESRFTPFGIGAGIFYTRNLSDRFSLRAEGGYNELAIEVGNPLKKYTMDLIYLDLLASFDIFYKGKFRPFIEGGVGAFNFEMIGSSGPDRFFDAEFILGGGLRWHLKPTMAVSFSGDFKYTTGDGLDGNIQGGNSVMDSYYSLRAGLTKYFGGKNDGESLDDEYFTDTAEIEDLSEDSGMNGDLESSDGELTGFLKQLDGFAGSESSLAGGGNSLAMQEYDRLKSRIEELKGSIDSRESEILTLRESLLGSNGTGNTLNENDEFLLIENNYDQELVSSISHFSNGYEDALNLFYSQHYQKAVDKFQALMEKYPNHVLLSSCEYWIGACFFNTGNFSRAIVSFERVIAVEQSLKKDDALLMMGRSYNELGESDKANEALTRLLTEFPDSEHLQKARELL